MNKITINGIEITNVSSIDVVGRRVIVDGKIVEELTIENNQLEIFVTGNLTSLSCDGSVNQTGDITGSVSAGGSIKCGNIGGNAKAGGSIKANSLLGKANAGGSIKIG